MAETDSPHYTRAVTRLGDRQVITTSESIYNENGLKLVERGNRIDSSLYEQLTRHKLLRPIDSSLYTDGMVDQASLIALTNQLLASDEALRQFAIEKPHKYRLSELIQDIALPAPIAFKLTVARAERPELFTHSVISLIITVYIAARAGLTREDTVNVATAALLHDLGLLHIDPELLHSGRRLSAAERRHLYAHPLVGELMVKPFSEYPPTVAEAICQHHERNDGSGYPRGLKRERIGRFGRILAVVEIVSSRFDSQGQCQACQQLDFILKMNTSKVDPELVAHFAPLLNAMRLQPGRETDNTGSEQLYRCVDKLSALFSSWEKLQPQLAGEDSSGPAGFVAAQMQLLSTTLNYAGLNLGSLAELLAQCSDDAEAQQEIFSALREVNWQLKGVWNELVRRWPERLEGDGKDPLGIWLGQLGDAMEGGAPREE